MSTANTTYMNQLETLHNNFKRMLASDAASLIELHKKHTKSPGRPAKWLNPVTRASVLLISAQLESFIEETVCYGIRFLIDNKTPGKKFSDGFRIKVIHQKANMRNMNAKEAVKMMALVARLTSDTDPIIDDDIDLVAIRTDFGNPKPSNVDDIMSLLGYCNYTKTTTFIYEKNTVNMRDALNELVQTRNGIAHGSNSSGVKLSSVKKFRKYALSIATAVKRDTAISVSSCF